jgi:hypothetical protein
VVPTATKYGRPEAGCSVALENAPVTVTSYFPVWPETGLIVPLAPPVEATVPAFRSNVAVAQLAP